MSTLYDYKLLSRVRVHGDAMISMCFRAFVLFSTVSSDPAWLSESNT